MVGFGTKNGIGVMKYKGIRLWVGDIWDLGGVLYEDGGIWKGKFEMGERVEVGGMGVIFGCRRKVNGFRSLSLERWERRMQVGSRVWRKCKDTVIGLRF
jgi:hypothetical protein